MIWVICAKTTFFLSQISKYTAYERLERFFCVRRKPSSTLPCAHSIIYVSDIHNDAVAPKKSMKRQSHIQNHSYHDIMIRAENIVPRIDRNLRSRTFSEYWKVSSIKPSISSIVDTQNCDFFVFFCRKSRILRLTHVQKYCRKERLVGIKSYLIFVNCGKPPHHLAMLKYTKTCVNLQQISQNRPKLCVTHKIDINFAQN